MSDQGFTKKGYKLEHSGTLMFTVSAVSALGTEKGELRKYARKLTSLVTYVPCCLDDIQCALRALVSVYQDEELTAQVDAVTQSALVGLQEATPEELGAQPKGGSTIN
jgi:hypothetical protein